MIITKLPYGQQPEYAGHFVCEKCQCEWSATCEDIQYNYGCADMISWCPYCHTKASIPIKQPVYQIEDEFLE